MYDNKSRNKRRRNCYQTNALRTWSNGMIWKGKCFYGLLKTQEKEKNWEKQWYLLDSIQTFQIKLTNTKKNLPIDLYTINIKIWVTKYSYKQLYKPRERIAGFIVLNLNMHWSTTFLQYHRCRIVTCIYHLHLVAGYNNTFVRNVYILPLQN